MAVVRNLMVRAGFDASDMRRGIDQAQRRLSDFSRTTERSMHRVHNSVGENGGMVAEAFGAIGIKAAGIVGAVLAAKEALEGLSTAIGAATGMAMKYEGSIGLLNRSLGDQADEFGDWMKSQGAALGISKAALAQYGSTYANLLRNMSKSNVEAEQSTEDFIRTTQVIATATGRAFDDVGERLRSGLLGETDAIEDLGIFVSEGMITSTEAFRRFAGDKSWQNLDFQTQNLIRKYAILEQAAKSYGVTISDNILAKNASFSSSLRDVQLAFGQVFAPIYNAALPALTAFSNAVANAINVVAQLSTAFFGSTSAPVAQQQAAVKSQTTAVTALGDAHEAAGEKAKKANGFLAGFDEVNTISKDSGADSAAGAGAGSGVGAFTPGMGDLKAMEVPKWITEAATKLQPLKEAFQGAWNAAAGLINTIKDSLPWKTLGELIGKISVNQLISGFGQLEGIFKIASGAISGVSSLLRGDFSGAIKGAETAVSGWYGFTVNTISKLIPGARGPMTDFGKWFGGKWDDFKGIVGDTWKGIELAVPPAWNLIRGAVSTAWGKFTDGTSIVWTSVKTAVGSTWTAIETAVPEAWTKIRTALANTWATFTDGTQIIWTAVYSKVTDSWSSIQKGVKGAWEGIRSALNTVWKTFTDGKTITWDSIKNAIDTVWKDVTLSTENTWESLKTTIKDSINWVIDKVNGFITKLNGLEIKIPEISIPGTDIKLGGGSIGFPDLPTIPRLKNGGITNGPMMAVIGDNITGSTPGQEVVSPLDDLVSIVESAVSASMAAQGGQRSDVVLNIDGREFARIAAPYLDREVSRKGTVRLRTT